MTLSARPKAGFKPDNDKQWQAARNQRCETDDPQAPAPVQTHPQIDTDDLMTVHSQHDATSRVKRT
ncbi:hypothetical protein GCM10008957_55310 [Deinococcus ruber]|uniref:Uncharacterized protein n=1 Tax=Deinococcus ruber TaxID=1848197 RepID=A0A918FII9_9DEIO|nr:hypothetical protein GCM10008957_55310 [Deinococcus ruber]